MFCTVANQKNSKGQSGAGKVYNLLGFKCIAGYIIKKLRRQLKGKQQKEAKWKIQISVPG